jgi:hypothetical protein
MASTTGVKPARRDGADRRAASLRDAQGSCLPIRNPSAVFAGIRAAEREGEAPGGGPLETQVPSAIAD